MRVRTQSVGPGPASRRRAEEESNQNDGENARMGCLYNTPARAAGDEMFINIQREKKSSKRKYTTSFGDVIFLPVFFVSHKFCVRTNYAFNGKFNAFTKRFNGSNEATWRPTRTPSHTHTLARTPSTHSKVKAYTVTGGASGVTGWGSCKVSGARGGQTDGMHEPYEKGLCEPPLRVHKYAHNATHALTRAISYAHTRTLHGQAHGPFAVV